MKATLLRHCQTRRAAKVALAASLGLTFVIPGQTVLASPNLPTQSCDGTPPCVLPTTATIPQALPDATTTSSTAAASVVAGGRTATGGSSVGGTSQTKGSLALTGGDIAGMLLIGSVLVGSGATAVVLGRRRRRAGHYG